MSRVEAPDPSITISPSALGARPLVIWPHDRDGPVAALAITWAAPVGRSTTSPACSSRGDAPATRIQQLPAATAWNVAPGSRCRLIPHGAWARA